MELVTNSTPSCLKCGKQNRWQTGTFTCWECKNVWITPKGNMEEALRAACDTMRSDGLSGWPWELIVRALNKWKVLLDYPCKHCGGSVGQNHAAANGSCFDEAGQSPKKPFAYFEPKEDISHIIGEY